MSTHIQSNKLIYLVAALVSLFLSYYITKLQDIINPDAICYLLSAKAIDTAGVTEAMKLCGQAAWPFYSIVIYLFSTLTHWPVETNAYVIDSIFSLFSVLFFIAIVQQLGANKRILMLAAIVILASHTFNNAREYIVRDHGFWTFYLSSIFFILRYVKTAYWFYAISWALSLGIAMLFRIEGLFFLIGIPFVVWFNRDWSYSKRTQFFFMLYSLAIGVSVALSIGFMLHPASLHAKWGRLSDFIHQYRFGLWLMMYRFSQIKTTLTPVFNQVSAQDISLTAIVSIIVMYVLNVMNVFSWTYGSFIMTAIYFKKILFEKHIQAILIAYLVINVFITFIFFSETLFLSKRYLVALALVGMLWLPFALDIIFNSKKRFLITMTAFSLLYSAFAGVLHFGPSKIHIKNAGIWLSNNVSQTEAIYTNDVQLMYYSNHFNHNIFQKAADYRAPLTNKTLKKYQYIALRANVHGKPLPITKKLTMIKTFTNNRGDKIIIYKT